ncbi:THAP domain-containing protein 5 [Solenopsis invicta]|uniref:THAP domain-containing protein 5 n=1 Tax=Solenopsis invicta TaxID=13686 RepID=UPI00193C9889|nr:THAP domain-containing protein 5 [Solenopsis invicta]
MPVEELESDEYARLWERLRILGRLDRCKMPSCSARKCANSWKKHFKVCYFPLNDPQRCAIWVANMKRENWTPNKHSALCQVHFAPKMWENKRQDNLLKLKRNAVPTLFEDAEEAKTGEALNNATFININENQEVVAIDVEAPNQIVEEDDVAMLHIFTLSSKDDIINDTEMQNEIYSNSAGYEELLRHMPLPSLRTLRRRLQNVKFNSGILDEMFEFLKLKVACFKNNLDKHCILVMDEMSITPSKIFDPSTNTFMGYATLGNHKDEKNIATHALVFMLAGIASRWKQIVGYYFTGTTVDGINT